MDLHYHQSRALDMHRFVHELPLPDFSYSKIWRILTKQHRKFLLFQPTNYTKFYNFWVNFSSMVIVRVNSQGNFFHALEMRANDSSPRKTPRQPFFRRKSECWFVFASIHPPLSLNQGQLKIFTHLYTCDSQINITTKIL